MLSALQKNIDRDFNENINLNHLIKKNNNNTIENVDTRTLGTRISHIYVIWETICVIW